MRLTKHRKVRFLGFSQRNAGEKYIADLYEKLMHLEDIEEEFGIDLITLFKTLKNGIWHKKFKNILYVAPENLYIDNEMTFYKWDGGYFEAIANYNNKIFKWSLTKEELE